MLRAILLGLLVIGAAGMAGAQDVPLRALDGAADAQPWAGVGRVNIGSDGFCTGTLIRPNVVLTAAHCFFDERGRQVGDGVIRFVAGLNQGRAVSIRGVNRVLIAPGFRIGDEAEQDMIGRDLALMELDQPILGSLVAHFGFGRGLAKGAEVSVVSYTREREESASIQDVCTVLATDDTVRVLSCDVSFGASGAPVFRTTRGVPEVVSVISAMAMSGPTKVALSVAVDGIVDNMLADILRGVPERRVQPVGVGLAAQLGRSGGKTGLPQIGN